MNVSAWSIRNPVPALLLFLVLCVAGMLGLRQLPIQNFPDFDTPTISVTATLEGAAPSQLETEVARKLEDKLATLGHVEHISTTVTDGTVSITINFEADTDPEEDLSAVRNAVDSARADLPSDVAPPVIAKVTRAGDPLITYTVQAPHLSEADLSWFVDNDLGKALRGVRGVGAFTRLGGVEREVHVQLDSAALAGMGLSPADVSAQIAAVQTDASGGRGEIGRSNQSMRTIGRRETPGELSALAIPVTSAGGHKSSVRLDQIARVSDTTETRFAYAALNGTPTVGFRIERLRGASEVSVRHDVREAVKAFAGAHPQVRLTEAYNSVQPTQDNYDASMHLLFEGALLAVIVVWAFLRDWRATLVSAVALPLSIIPTFAVMSLLGYSLNLITLLALSLVVGVLVDDAIVEVENIVRHLRMGKSPMQAALEAADEIGLAVIATTFTLVAVFLPTAFMAGVPGKFFKPFGVTASVAVLVSLLVARLLTPMMAAYLLRPHVDRHAAGEDGRVMRSYLKAARWCQQHRKTTVALALAFFISTLGLIALLPTSFVPAADRSLTTIALSLEPGTRLETTRDIAERATWLARQVPEVRQVFTVIGDAESDASSSEVNKATLVLSLVPREERSRKQPEIEQQLRTLLKGLPGTRVSVLGMGNGQTLDITLASDDAAALNKTTQAVLKELRGIPGIGNVSDSSALQRPEVQVHPDPVRMAEQGVTTEAIGKVLRVATHGDYSAQMAKFNLAQRQIAIRVQVGDGTRDSLEALGQLRVAGRNGAVPLSSVADLSMGGGLAQIGRLDRMRNVTLSIELGKYATGDLNKRVQALPSMRSLPAGVQQLQTGDAQRMAELFTSFGIAMAIGVLCIYCVLVLLFHDFMQPATILAALPLSTGGAFLALWITRSGFSLPSVIGLLMLMGIVTKNSILLVEYAVVAYRQQGMSRLDALMDACHKRAQPILMTTIAMAAGMLPVALGIGNDNSFRGPMAIVVIGGLLTSTVLSLLVVPVVFTYVDDFLLWLKHLAQRMHLIGAATPSSATGASSHSATFTS
ncbi:efflux RND transporter permease subunit [Ideonella azotifigens]|uniref:Efflux RND transporter permease subunit n=1 Tax=Ideonella azotifigens TaxID=513160 RepID=A0ABN1KKL2_9BURK|nr:efflux RND transporter permease subunit [Ideonella azotifigens]MCD2339211.1 efflux RND transporter permease subunit [Ideonella azotifigens]